MLISTRVLLRGDSYVESEGRPLACALVYAAGNGDAGLFELSIDGRLAASMKLPRCDFECLLLVEFSGASGRPDLARKQTGYRSPS